MCSKSRWLAIAWVTATAGNAQAGNMAIYCELALLLRAHETLVHCGEQIDPASESRYDKLVGDYRSFIAANPAPKKQYDGDVGEIQKQLRKNDRNLVCTGCDYTLWHRTFVHAVSDVGMAEVGEQLSRPRDPSEGDCF